jgi:threonine aldolase
MVERLADDHANAKRLANGLAQINGIRINADEVETNLVFFEVDRPDLTASQLSAGLAARGVLMNAAGTRRLRAALNYHVNATDVDATVEAIRDLLATGAQPNGQTQFVYH